MTKLSPLRVPRSEISESARPITEGDAGGVTLAQSDQLTTSTAIDRQGADRLSIWWRVVIIAVVLVVLGVIGRDYWFFDDDWVFLTSRPPGELDSWLRPHNGHWMVWAGPMFWLLELAVGFNYWPWYYLPRLAAAGLLGLLLWRTYERRGAPAGVALVATLVFLVLRVTAFHRAVSCGNYIVMAVLVGVASLVALEREPTRRDLVALTTLLLVGVMSFGSGVAVLGAAGLVVVFSKRWRWWPCFVAPAAVYLGWTLAYSPRRGYTIADIPEIPGIVVSLAGDAAASLVAAPHAVGLVMTWAAIAVLGWWWWKGRLDRFDAVAVLTAVIFLAATALQRIVPGWDGSDNARYGFVPIVALSLVFVPRIKVSGERWRAAALTLAGVALIAVNLVTSARAVDRLTDSITDRRAIVESTGALVDAGEPGVTDSSVDRPLTVGGLTDLVNRGWAPALHADLEARARGILTVGMGANNEIDGFDATGCPVLRPGDSSRFTVAGANQLLAASGGRAFLELQWTGPNGPGNRVIVWGQGHASFHGQNGRFELVTPPGPPTVFTATLLRGSPVTLCAPSPGVDQSPP